MVFKAEPTSGESFPPPSMAGSGLYPRPLLHRDSLPARRPFYNPRLIGKVGNRLFPWKIGTTGEAPRSKTADGAAVLYPSAGLPQVPPWNRDPGIEFQMLLRIKTGQGSGESPICPAIMRTFDHQPLHPRVRKVLCQSFRRRWRLEPRGTLPERLLLRPTLGNRSIRCFRGHTEKSTVQN